MPEAEEVLADNEFASFERTMSLGITTVIAEVTLDLPSVHKVVLATRADGCSLWVDHDCGRASTPAFDAARKPFVDEAVAAWHDGATLDPYDYAGLLVAARQKVLAARAKTKDCKAAKVGVRPAQRHVATVERERAEIIVAAMTKASMALAEIAEHAGVALRTVYFMRERMSDENR